MDPDPLSHGSPGRMSGAHNGPLRASPHRSVAAQRAASSVAAPCARQSGAHGRRWRIADPGRGANGDHHPTASRIHYPMASRIHYPVDPSNESVHCMVAGRGSGGPGDATDPDTGAGRASTRPMGPVTPECMTRHTGRADRSLGSRAAARGPARAAARGPARRGRRAPPGRPGSESESAPYSRPPGRPARRSRVGAAPA